MCNLKILLALFYSFKVKSLSHTCFDKSSIYNNFFLDTAIVASLYRIQDFS